MNEWEQCISEWADRNMKLQQQLADAQATVEALREQLRLANIDQANAEARVNNAQQQVEALQRERDKLREATKVICGHCCEPMAIPSKAILQSQLSALQGLVRVFFTEPDPHKWTAAYRTLKRMGRVLQP